MCSFFFPLCKHLLSVRLGRNTEWHHKNTERSRSSDWICVSARLSCDLYFCFLSAGSCCPSAPGADPVPRHRRSTGGPERARQAVGRPDLCRRVHQHGGHRDACTFGGERHPVSAQTGRLCHSSSACVLSCKSARWKWLSCFLQLWWDVGLHPHRLLRADGSRHCVLGPYLPVLHQTGATFNHMAHLLGHHSFFHSTGFLQKFMDSFFFSLFIFYVFIPAESEWALLPSYRSYYVDIAGRVWATLTQGQTLNL